ncbi:hypothetical protein [Corynebacterium sp.]|uniref:hypothetical protein n=1 Tax=Corynebacterium sp. TaxID=1720 RepID=UPI003B3B0948
MRATVSPSVYNERIRASVNRSRNNWHIHPASPGGGQILLCTDGSGWYQAEGEAPPT